MMEQNTYTPKALPGNTNHAIGDVIAAAETLEEIYNAEIDALQKPDARAFMDLQDSKIEAAQNYYSVMMQMLERKNELKDIDPTTKRRLHEMHRSFSNTTRANMKVVKRMKRYSERLGDTIRNAALRAARQSNALSYSQNGESSGVDPRRIISSGLSETV